MNEFQGKYPPHLGEYIGSFESENKQVSAILFQQKLGVVAYVKVYVEPPTDRWVTDLKEMAKKHGSELVHIRFS